MAKIASCLFDLDGVIVDTAKYHYHAWKRLCNDLGFDLTPVENEKLKGISRKKSLEMLLEKGGIELSEEDKQKYMTLKNGWYLEYVDRMQPDETLPGVVEFLNALKSEGKKIALGSSSRNASRILDKIGLTEIFDAIIDGNKVQKGKPDPQTFTLGAEATGVHPSECVVFEDSIAGVDAGIAGGMYTIGVGKPEVLTRANLVVPGFEGLDTGILNEL